MIDGALRPSLSGILHYHLLPVRRRTVLANMRRVFRRELSEADRRRLAQCFYGHLIRTLREHASMIWTSERRLSALVDVVGVEHASKAAEQGKGLLILTGHFGNWEMAAVAALLQYEQFRDRFHVIRKRLVAPLEWIAPRRFRKVGFDVFPRDGALVRAADALERNDAVIYIMDQHASRGPKAVEVEFFGSRVWTNRGLALLAGHTGAAVIPATSYRTRDGRHVMRFEPPLPWITAEDSEEEIYLNTRQYNQVLERFILEHPDQWFWMHQRWKQL